MVNVCFYQPFLFYPPTPQMDDIIDSTRANALFQFASIGILLTNAGGEILMSNPAALRLFGYDEGDALKGQAVEVLVPKHLAEGHVRQRDQYTETSSMRIMGHKMDIYGLRKDGSEFPVEVGLSPFDTKEGQMIFVFIQDITVRRQQEAAILQQRQALANLSQNLRDLNEALEKRVAERTLELEHAKADLEAALHKEKELGELKSGFVTMASHEFRTPLSGILSSSGLIERYSERNDRENVRKHVELIKKAVNHLNHILAEFLSLGHLEGGHVQPRFEAVDLKRCVEEVYEQLRDLLKDRQSFQHRHEGSNSSWSDAAILHNILTNLISNAIKYSPEGATIVVETLNDEQKTLLKVIDNGPGLPKNEQKHLFDRFYRASNAVNVKGTGLGLYIVKRYAEMLNGTVGFDSTPGKGSSFWVEFKH